jgi:hypothetical protein
MADFRTGLLRARPAEGSARLDPYINGTTDLL